MLLVMLPLLSGNGKIVQALEVHGLDMHKAFANRAKLWYHCELSNVSMAYVNQCHLVKTEEL
ncbi:hypothetical protein CUMW_174610, partial [Citrus unshiu]